MKKLIIFLIISVRFFSIEKYKDEDILSKWDVENGKTDLVYHKEKSSIGFLNSIKRQNELWDILCAYYPKDVVKKITKFIVFSDNNLDNAGGMYGLVEANDKTNTNFTVSIDIEDAYYYDNLNLESYLPLLTHEFFHIISLDENQISKEFTGGLQIYEGFARENSYLNKFNKEFWNNSIGKKLEILDRDGSLSYMEKRSIRENSYLKNQDKYLNSYAMTNVVEDIAVSFEAFVSLNKAFLGQQLKDKKISFFYAYKELVRYKEYFLRKRGELLQKNKKS